MYRWLAAVVALSCALVALAGPAPWYRWRGIIDGQTVCRQISPGPGWEQVSGPFQDAHCQKRGRPSA